MKLDGKLVVMVRLPGYLNLKIDKKMKEPKNNWNGQVSTIQDT